MMAAQKKLKIEYYIYKELKMKKYNNRKFKSKPKKLNWFQKIVKKVKNYFI